jgi:DNA excision repair protein ERCC-2
MSLRWDDHARTLDLGVQDVLQGSERSVRALAMSSRARLAAGVALHAEVQAASEGPGFASEVRLRHRRVLREWTVTLHARLDGVIETDEGALIEEIKSTGLPGEALAGAEGFPAWERQLRVYLWMARGEGWTSPRGLLRVVSLVDGAQRVWTVDATDAEATGAGVLAWLDEQLRAREAWILWRAVRRAAPVPFAHAEPRPGQAEAADVVAETVATGGHLLLSAPTGAGKTATVLHGVLREAATRDLQVYWATARTTQAAVVEATVAAMQARGLRLRTVTLRAKPSMCLRTGGVDCRPEACAYAAGHHDRAPDALLALPERARAEDLLAVGRAHRCCPHALGHARAETADLVIGDLNHGFDPDVRTLALDAGWVVVVDEAHQLPERALGWGSPTLAVALVERARAWVPAGSGWDAFRALADEIADTLADAALLSVGQVGEELLVEPHARRWLALRDRADELALDHAALVAVLPTEAAGGGVTEGGGSPPPSHESAEVGPDPWTELVWALARFAGALERAGEDLVATWSPERLQLVARDAAGVLGPRFARVHASVHASATLAPAWFHRESCGLHLERVREHALPEAFPPERRCVLVVPGVSTAYRARERQRGALVEALQRCVDAVPGNVALWFGSFEQRDDLVGACDWPEREVLLQTRGMDEAARAGTLARMRETAGPAKVLAGVLGGVFAEGVDLPGESLLATVVVGPSLPPPSATLALRQAWWEDRFDAGFELASVRPGMVRVVQAAGRVVRGPEDRGAVVLLCSRFLQHGFAAYLPEAWEVRKARRPWEALAAFFAPGREPGARQLGLFSPDR